jgi:peptidoglycan hydrolase CwlO-like protein
MSERIKKIILLAYIIVFSFVCITIPIQASGAVKPIEETEDKLEGVTAQQKVVLEQLFTVAQKIEQLENDKVVLNSEIDTLLLQIEDIKSEIEDKQLKYEVELQVLEKVLVNYQRGGPASYLEILLGAENLTTFLKSINIIKDISKNVSELLVTLEEEKTALQEEKDTAHAKEILLEEKRSLLQDNLEANQKLKEGQEVYLASLKEDQVYYEEQLANLNQMWMDCTNLFGDVVDEMTKIINAGYFTTEDLHINYGINKIDGAIKEETFNRILSENSDLTEIIFEIKEDQVVIAVPDKHLVLSGDFVIEGDTALLYQVKSGTFYDMPIEEASMEELFAKGPLLIDFQAIAGENITIKFKLSSIESQDGQLVFEIKPEW